MQPPGTYTCQDWATINGEDMLDAAGNLITEQDDPRAGHHVDPGDRHE